MVRYDRTDDALFMRGLDRSGCIHITRRGEAGGLPCIGFSAASVSDLEALATTEDFGDVTSYDGPGGGYIVSGIDPNGFQIDVLAERELLDSLEETPTPHTQNSAIDRPRCGETVELSSAPSHIARIGHCVLQVSDFLESDQWYKAHLGLVTSDQIDLDPGTTIGAFLRCDQGDQYVDHHTVFLLLGQEPAFNHAAFEVVDFDDLMLGHTHLHSTGRTHQWGVGRHILGSQIYDYWRDPHGHVLEHWTDGDLLNGETPPNRVGIEELVGSQWGPTAGGPP